MSNARFNTIARVVAGVAISATLLVGAGQSARASDAQVVATVSLSNQRMDVTVDGRAIYHWKVSTGRHGHVTPKGKFKPTRMYTMWHSRTYDNAPMAHSVFFHEGYAVHATPYVRALGRPASHGCVRLLPKNATKFFKLVRMAGFDHTSIVITQ